MKVIGKYSFPSEVFSEKRLDVNREYFKGITVVTAPGATGKTTLLRSLQRMFSEHMSAAALIAYINGNLFNERWAHSLTPVRLVSKLLKEDKAKVLKSMQRVYPFMKSVNIGSTPEKYPQACLVYTNEDDRVKPVHSLSVPAVAFYTVLAAIEVAGMYPCFLDDLDYHLSEEHLQVVFDAICAKAVTGNYSFVISIGSTKPVVALEQLAKTHGCYDKLVYHRITRIFENKVLTDNPVRLVTVTDSQNYTTQPNR